MASQPRKEVSLVPDKGNTRGEFQVEYIKLSLEKKAEIGKYASENGVAKATKYFVDLNLKESSVRDWRDAYLKEVRELRKMANPGDEIVVAKFPSKKRGRPVLIGERFDKQLQEKLIAMRFSGTPIGTSAVIGIGLGILKKHRSSDDRSIKLTKSGQGVFYDVWDLLKGGLFVSQKYHPEFFSEIKEQF